jgi:hypothetical protein
MKRSSKPRKNGNKRPLGLFRGQIWIAPDFDAPLELVETSELLALRSKNSKTTKRTIKKAKSKTKSSPKR